MTGKLLKVAVAANAIAGDVDRKRIYATVPGKAEQYPNRLVTIDAENGQVIDDVPVGSEPTTLALSDDGSTLWVSISGAYAIRRIDLLTDTPTPGMQYALPAGDLGDLAAARPMVVLPGTTDSVAVSMHYDGLSPSFAGLVVLDAGVARAMRTPGHTGASRLTVGPEGYLFGFNNLSTGYDFFSIAVTADGVTQTQHSSLINGFNSDIAFAGDFVFASSGEVVDVHDPAMPVRAGTFPVSGLVLPQADGKTAWMLTIDGSFEGSLSLHELDRETFTDVAQTPLSGADVEFGNVRDLVRVTADTLAFIAVDSSGESTAVYIANLPAPAS